jgi:hypothetical protein
VDESGEFLERSELAAPPIGTGADWSQARLAFGGEGARVAVNGAAAAALPGDSGGVRRVGFRGAAIGARVDDVVLAYRDGSPPGADGFGSRRSGIPFFAVACALLAAASAGLFRLLRRATSRSPRALHFGLLAAWFALAGVLAALAWLDFAHFSRLYPRNPYELHGTGYANHSQDVEATVEALRARSPSRPEPGVRRVLLVGTSQTWGSGARRAEESLDRVLAERLAAGPPPLRVEVVNAGLSGQESPYLLDLISWC